MPISEPDVEILRRLSSARKLAVMASLIEQAWSLKAAVIRDRRPDLAPAEITRLARKAVAGERG
jgi:hypothetical protein